MVEIYDKKSDIKWFYTGETLTAKQMMDRPEYEGMFRCTAILFTNGAGSAYYWRDLSDLAAEYAVPSSGDPEEVLELINNAANGTYRAPGVAEVEEKADAAQTAAQTASETAATAQAAADEAKTTAGTAAASMNEYLDALLGLNTTDETEATDAE